MIIGCLVSEWKLLEVKLNLLRMKTLINRMEQQQNDGYDSVKCGYDFAIIR